METRLLCIEPAGEPAGSTLRCAGEIDLGNVEEFRRALAHSIGTGLPDVDVDLVQITFLDSSAIKALLEAQRELGRRKGRLRVCGGRRSASLLRLLGLDGLLQLTEVAPNERVPTDDLRWPVACGDSMGSDDDAPCEPAAALGCRWVGSADPYHTDVSEVG